jgi:hypothetical protein
MRTRRQRQRGGEHAKANKKEYRLRRLSNTVTPQQQNQLAREYTQYEKAKREENIERSVSHGLVEEILEKIDPKRSPKAGGKRRTRRRSMRRRPTRRRH